ncbi:MAG: HD domain-containing protein [Clostridiales bacterium]|nr:HD domain-containing protein [Clostridiales bacterium]
MKTEIDKVLPELEVIQDAGLREKTRTVWVEALKRGGWEVEDLNTVPFTLLIPGTDVTLVEHTRAVTLTALRIAEVLAGEYRGKIHIHRDHLLSGSLLHDVGKLFEYERKAGKFVKSGEGELLRHPISGAAFAFQHGLPSEVIHIIATHSKEGDGSRRTIEAIIVNHADFVNFDVFKE